MFQRISNVAVFGFIFFSFPSCEIKKDEVFLELIVKDENRINEELIAKGFLNNDKWEIIHAYFDCENNKSINYAKEEITCCEKILFVKNNTIYIGFTPTELGMKSFDGIEVLIKDRNSKFKMVSGSFNYNIVGGE